MSNKIYAVMQAVGNFSHTLEEFECEDYASEFVMNRAIEDVREAFTDDEDYINQTEDFEEELELALSYYSIDEWEVM